jgi:hypothetical protein
MQTVPVIVRVSACPILYSPPTAGSHTILRDGWPSHPGSYRDVNTACEGTDDAAVLPA